MRVAAPAALLVWSAAAVAPAACGLAQVSDEGGPRAAAVGDANEVAGASEGAGGAAGAGERPPLLLVSFDGFRHDYPELVPTPNFARLAARGVRAESLVPPFPSKTFPSHYTIVTGLYPGHHGIISNNMRDPRWPERFALADREQVQDGRWWGGEPIWVTAHRRGLRTAVYFWPGSEAPIAGVQPDVWFPYDGAVPYEERVQRVLAWLGQPPASRPAFVALYFDEPNGAGHRHGPLAAETRAAIRRADATLGRLLDGIDRLGVEVNLIVVSDHGMAQNDPARVILLDRDVELFPDELLEQGALVQIFPRRGRAERIYRALARLPHLAVYRRGGIPARLHLYDNPRLPPILATPEVGWEALTRRQAAAGVIPGDHGQDPAHPDMHGIFLAAGPAFARGARVPAIEAVDVYGLMAAALGIEPAPNDGVPARTAGILARRDR